MVVNYCHLERDDGKCVEVQMIISSYIGIGASLF